MRKLRNTVQERKRLLLRLGVLALTLLFTGLLLSQAVFARTTYVITDGDTVLVHTTFATDPAAVLTEAGFTLRDEDTFTAQADGDVSEIEITVTRLQHIEVHTGGRVLVTETYGSTVEEILASLDIDLESTRVTPEPETPTADGMIIRVVHITHETEEYLRADPYETVYCLDETLAPGQEKVISQGTEGSTYCTDWVTYEDGVEVDRTTVAQQIISAPVDMVVGRGLDRTVMEQEGADRVYTRFLNTLGFGSHESPGPGGAVVKDNGHEIITADGTVIPYRKKLNVEATAYSYEKWSEKWHVTAVGTKSRYGAIAVDPRIIPYGTEMYVVSNDGEYIYGFCTAEDCGAFEGYKIDLYFDKEDDCWIFGRRRCTVYILGRG